MGISMDISMDIPMDIHEKNLWMDVDMDGKFHIHDKPANQAAILSQLSVHESGMITGRWI